MNIGINSAMARNWCSSHQNQEQTRSLKPIEKMLAKTCEAGAETEKPRKQPPPSVSRPAKPKNQATKVAYRTMCVRLCDGYYYPIAFPADALTFERDSQSCQNSCPGATTALFKHRVDEESQTMVEVNSNTPYTEFENAFTYRQTNVSGCSCSTSEKGERLFTLSASRRQLLSSAQTLSPNRKKDIGKKQRRLPKIPDLTNVRTIGPTFLPEPEQSIDLGKPLPAEPAPKLKQSTTGQ